MIKNSKAINGFVQMCDDGWNAGWHERNGGNATYRMSKDEVKEIEGDYCRRPIGLT